MTDLLATAWLGTPLWLWFGFLAAIALLLALDLLLFHRDDRAIGLRESLGFSAFYLSLGLAFGGLVWWQLGARPGLEYLTGFLVEKSLAIDNLFVIAMIFGTKKLRNIGSDLGGAVKGFKEGMKEAQSTDSQEPQAQQRVASGETIDVQAKEKSASQ